MQFKQEVPTKDGYYYTHQEGSTHVEILQRKYSYIGEHEVIHWYAMGCCQRLGDFVISKTYFGEKVRFPRVVQNS
jgi:hypothetical protein